MASGSWLTSNFPAELVNSPIPPRRNVPPANCRRVHRLKQFLDLERRMPMLPDIFNFELGEFYYSNSDIFSLLSMNFDFDKISSGLFVVCFHLSYLW